MGFLPLLFTFLNFLITSKILFSKIVLTLNIELESRRLTMKLSCIFHYKTEPFIKSKIKTKKGKGKLSGFLTNLT